MWEILGIAPTDDTRQIRKAYAARLREIDADRDPGAFQRLRAAYEGALRSATLKTSAPALSARDPSLSQVTAVVEPAVATRVAARDVPLAQSPQEIATASLAQEIEMERTEIRKAIKASLDEGNFELAFENFERGAARGLMPIGARDSSTDMIVKSALDDKAIAPERFRNLVNLVGWGGRPRNEVISPTRRAAMQRADAEDWYVYLMRLAAGPKNHDKNRFDIFVDRLQSRLLPSPEQRNARLLLGQTQWLRVSRKSATDLKKKIAMTAQFGDAIAFRIPASQLARATRVANTQRPLRMAYGLVYISLALIFALGGTAAIVVTPPAGIFAGALAYRLGRVGYKILQTTKV